MKKRTLLLLLSIVLCFSSCMKEDDFGAFSGNLDIVGDFNPTFGIPVAKASVNIGQLLGMVQEIQGFIAFDSNTDDHVLFISYDTIIDTSIYFNNKKDNQTLYGAKDGSTQLYTYHQMMRGNAQIDLFKNIPSADQLSVNGVRASLDLYLKAFSDDPTINDLINRYHVNPYIKDIKISLVGQDGTPYILNLLDSDTILGTELIAGTLIHVVDTDFSQYLNCRPRSIQYEFSFYIPITASAGQAISAGSLILDSVKINHVDTKATLVAHFPLELACDDLPYNVDLNVDLTKMDDVLAKVRKYLTLGDSSYIFFDFKNSLPVELQFTDELIDGNGQIIRTATGEPAHLGLTGTGTIKGAPIAQQQAGSQNWVSQGAESTTLQALIGHKQAEYLEKVKKIRLHLNISTSKFQGAQKHVSLRAEDHLDINAYIRADADLHFDYNILGSEDPNNHNK